MNYMNYMPFSNIYIDEYDNKDLISTKSTNISFPISTKDNQLISIFIYNVSSNLIKFISLKITPSYDINFMNIEFEFPINFFDLNDSSPMTIYNLISGNIYLFFIEATQYEKVNICLNFNFTSSEKPFNSIYLYEYEQRDNSYSSYHKNELKNITASIKESEYLVTISYTIDSYLSNYFAFSIIPLYNITYITSKFDISGGSFELKNNSIKNIGYLIAKNDYYLFIPSKQFNNVNLELTMNYMTNTPFSDVSISELFSRKKSIDYYKSQSISFKTKNNQLITSFPYF